MASCSCEAWPLGLQLAFYCRMTNKITVYLVIIALIKGNTSHIVKAVFESVASPLYTAFLNSYHLFSYNCSTSAEKWSVKIFVISSNAFWVLQSLPH